MRKLKLQMQITLDGFVAGPNGEMDWLVWDWDEELQQYVGALTESVDDILLGRVLAEGFIPTWKARADNPETADAAAHTFVNLPKHVFSKTLITSEWENASVVNGDLVAEVERLKMQPGRDLIVYGGASFVSDLIKHKLIDDYYLFVNPVAIGKGMPIFASLDNKADLVLVEGKTFSCGIIGLHYQPKHD
jgi:dihydrofolate reductase